MQELSQMKEELMNLTLSSKEREESIQQIQITLKEMKREETIHHLEIGNTSI